MTQVKKTSLTSYGNLQHECVGTENFWTNSYVYGHSLISQTDSSSNQTYFLGNALGSTGVLTDGSGNATGTKTYEPFGTVRATTVSGSTEYLFTGEQNDATLGYTYLRARYYDPAEGRFISQDIHPAKMSNPDTVNRYVYVLNNPVNMTDPTGECGWCVDILKELLDNLVSTFLESTNGSDSGDSSPEYVDVNATVTFPLGVTVGAVYTQGIDGGYSWTHSYFGPAGGSPPGSVSITASMTSITPGINIGFQGTNKQGISGQVGVSEKTHSPFSELGGGAPPGASGSLYYVFDNWWD